VDINAANENGDTALHYAAKWSYGMSESARSIVKTSQLVVQTDVS